MTEHSHDDDDTADASTGAHDPADADLILRTRSGDTDAFGQLWQRHHRSGLTVARSITSSLDPDDLVQEAYTRIYQSILKGGGPTGSFRAYLFTSIRNTAASWGRARRETAIDELDAMEDPASSEQATSEALDRSLTHRAFRALPTRWQEVLWYSEIEQMKPAEIAPLLGLKPTAVAQLAFRAREGLREAWIQAHLSSVADGSDCQWSIERLGAYARGNVGIRDKRRLEEHLAECARCAIVSAEARHVSDRLALVLLPLVLGITGAGAYLASLQAGAAPVVALAAMPSTVVQGAVVVGSGSVAPAGVGATAVAAGGSSGAVGSGGAVSMVAGSSGVGAGAISGGVFSSMGAMIGLAAAAVVVAGAVVTTTVIVPALSTTDTAAGSALASAEAGQKLADPGAAPLPTPSPTPSDVPVLESPPVIAPDAAAPSAPPVPTPSEPASAPPAVSTPPMEQVPPITPSEPTVPVGPTEPVDPTDPVDPVDPTDPVDPVDPTDPVEPVEPTDPVDPTDPAEPALPTGSPALESATISFDGTKLTIDLAVTAAPGSTIQVLLDDEVRGSVIADDAGSALVQLRPTAFELLLNPIVRLRYLAGEATGPSTDIRLRDLLP